MIDRFENLATGIAQIYKSIQKIKKYQMQSFGLKSTYVMCIYYLSQNPDGLSAAALCRLCSENKAGISRILSALAQNGFIRYDRENDGRKYRTKAVLTDCGREYAVKINSLIIDAVAKGGLGISDEEREIFYRVLFRIADNLNLICAELAERNETNEQNTQNILPDISDRI